MNEHTIYDDAYKAALAVIHGGEMTKVAFVSAYGQQVKASTVNKYLRAGRRLTKQTAEMQEAMLRKLMTQGTSAPDAKGVAGGVHDTAFADPASFIRNNDLIGDSSVPPLTHPGVSSRSSVMAYAPTDGLHRSLLVDMHDNRPWVDSPIANGNRTHGAELGGGKPLFSAANTIDASNLPLASAANAAKSVNKSGLGNKLWYGGAGLALTPAFMYAQNEGARIVGGLMFNDNGSPLEHGPLGWMKDRVQDAYGLATGTYDDVQKSRKLDDQLYTANHLTDGERWSNAGIGAGEGGISGALLGALLGGGAGAGFGGVGGAIGGGALTYLIDKNPELVRSLLDNPTMRNWGIDINTAKHLGSAAIGGLAGLVGGGLGGRS